MDARTRPIPRAVRRRRATTAVALALAAACAAPPADRHDAARPDAARPAGGGHGPAGADPAGADPAGADPVEPAQAVAAAAVVATPDGAGPSAATRASPTGRRADDPSVLVAAVLARAASLAPPGSHLHVEAVEQLGPVAAVVVLLVAGVEGVERVAVPVVVAPGGPRVGDPVSLPPPTSDRVPTSELLPSLPDAGPDAVAAAQQALRRAGRRGVRVLRLGPAVDAWPWVVAYREPDGDVITTWLRREADGFAVAGLPSPREERP